MGNPPVVWARFLFGIPSFPLSLPPSLFCPSFYLKPSKGGDRWGWVGSAQIYKKQKKNNSGEKRVLILANELGWENIGVIMFYGYLVRRMSSRRTRLWRGERLWI